MKEMGMPWRSWRAFPLPGWDGCSPSWAPVWRSGSGDWRPALGADILLEYCSIAEAGLKMEFLVVEELWRRIGSSYDYQTVNGSQFDGVKLRIVTTSQRECLGNIFVSPNSSDRALICCHSWNTPPHIPPSIMTFVHYRWFARSGEPHRSRCWSNRVL